MSAEIQKQSEIVKALEEKIIEISGQVQENSVSDFKDSLQNIEIILNHCQTPETLKK